MSGTNTAELAASIKSLGREWWLLASFGVITVLFGLVLAFKPGRSVHAIAVIFGIWLFIVGIVRLIQAIGAAGEQTGLFVIGLLAILIAIFVLRHTTATVAALGLVVGIFWTIGGVTEMYYGFSANQDDVSWPIVILGFIALMVGILCLLVPSLSLSIICVILGLGMIAYGIVEIVTSLHVRTLKETSHHLQHRPDAPAEAVAAGRISAEDTPTVGVVSPRRVFVDLPIPLDELSDADIESVADRMSDGLRAERSRMSPPDPRRAPHQPTSVHRRDTDRAPMTPPRRRS
jgi:uncharacterized membrane protein HdeD (DUF308 family)